MGEWTDGDPAGDSFPSVGDFTIIEVIGTGAFADVYRVSKGSLGAHFALKRWHAAVGADLLRKFAHECRLQFELSDHPNVVRLYWCEARPGEPPWLVTELYERSLENRLGDSEPLSRAEKVVIVDDLICGLEAIHGHGHVHRDVKPANVLLKHGRAALTDMGLALRVGEHTTANAAGTYPYAAPELARGTAPTTRSDVYSAATTIARILGPDLTPAVEKVLDQAQSLRPGDRPADAAELRRRLRAALDLADFPASGPTFPPVMSSAGGVVPPSAPSAVPVDAGAEVHPDAHRWTGRHKTLAAAAAVIVIAASAFAVAAGVDGGHPKSAAGRTPSVPAAGNPSSYSSTSPQTAVPPVASESPRSTPPHSTPPRSAVATGHITYPANGASVPKCQIIQGTAHVLAGQTIILAYRYVHTRNTQWYFQAVRSFLNPAALARWGGTQFFGDHNHGQSFELVALAMDRGVAAQNVNAHARTDHNWNAARLPVTATVLDRIQLTGSGAGESAACLAFDQDPTTSTHPIPPPVTTPATRTPATPKVAKTHPSPAGLTRAHSRPPSTSGPCSQTVTLSASQQPALDATVHVTTAASCTVPPGQALELIMEMYGADCGGHISCFYDKGPAVAQGTYVLNTPGTYRDAYVLQVAPDQLRSIESTAPSYATGGGWYGAAAEAFFLDPGNVVSPKVRIAT